MEITTYCKCACANCGQVIDYRTSQAGEIIKCPKCGEKSQLPEPEKLVMVEVIGPPVPMSRKCPVCGLGFNFFTPDCPDCAATRKHRERQKRIMTTVCVIALLCIAAIVARYAAKSGFATAATTAKVSTSNGSGSFIMIEAPRPRAPKSTNDLRPGRFTLEQRRGSDLAIAVGDIENISENLHSRLRADLDVLDRKGAKIGTVSDYFSGLGPHQRWHIVMTVTESNAMSVRFAGIKEEE